jgi:hypothetical protein
MKGMKSALDYYVPPNKGEYPSTVIAAEATFAKKTGASMIHIQTQIDGTSETVDDYLITDGTQKGAGIAKAKLRGLGVDVNTDAEIPDEQIAASLIGRKTIMVIDHEPSQRKNEAGEYVNATHYDPDTGKTIQLMRAVAKGYRQASVVSAPPPAQFAQAPAQQFAPPQQPYAQAPAQQFAPPQQYAPPAQQFAPPAGAFVPPGYAQQPAPPQQYAPPLPPAQAPWQQQAAPAPAPQQAAPAQATEGGKKRKLKVEDSAEG